MAESPQYENDHDTLIALLGEVRGLRNDIKELKDNYKDQIKDHEDRIRFIEKWVWGAIAVIASIQFIVIAYAYYLKK